jgi:hypothetical protein
MKRFTTIPWVGVFVFVLVLLYVIHPLLSRGFYRSDDGEWMVIRLSAFYQSLAEGQFPVRLLGRLNNSFGYPVATFLYPGFLYIGSLLHAFGVSFVDAVKVILTSSIVASSLLIYATLRRSFSKEASLLGAATYVTSPYLLYDLYRRGSVGEILAFLPASLLWFAVSTSTYWLLPLGVAFLIVSHNSLALILGGALGIYMLTQSNRVALVRWASVGVLMASFFWIPAIFERAFTVFDTIRISDPLRYFISWDNWLLLSVPTLIGLIYAGWMYKAKGTSSRWIQVLLFMGYFFALPLSVIFWQGELLPRIVQFPFRFLSIVVLFGPYIVSAMVDSVGKAYKGIVYGLLLVSSIYGAVHMVSQVQYVQNPEGYYTTNEATTTVGDEYLPIWVTQNPQKRANQPFEFVAGEVQITSSNVTTQKLSLATQSNQQSTLQINKQYYPGWGVTIDGILVPIDYQNPAGVIRVAVPAGNHTIVATFRETVFRFIADMLSIFGFGLYIWMIIFAKRRR